jgi:hypothetical protein
MKLQSNLTPLPRSCRFITTIALMVATAGAASAQTCLQVCSDIRYASRTACEATYQACVASAAGDPDLLAICLQQRTDCLTAADDAFVACAGSNCLSDPCVQDCGVYYGFLVSSCFDARVACMMNGGSEAQCAAEYEVCRAAAYQVYRECLFTCVPPVPVAPITWGSLKVLYRD